MCFFLFRKAREACAAKKEDTSNENPNPDANANTNADANQNQTAGATDDSPVTMTSMITMETQFGRNMLVVMVIGLTAALDYVMSLMSIQSYYLLLRGDPSLYGLAVGVYDLGQIVLTPFFGWFADKTGTYTAPFIFGLLMQLTGNLVYALLFYIEDRDILNHTQTPSEFPNLGWRLMIGMRFLAGCGSAILITGSSYITTHTTMKERFGALGSYRIWQTIARMAGPMTGFLFLGMPTPDVNVQDPDDTSTTDLLFNFYTMPGWIAFFFGVITLGLLLALFRETVEATAEEEYGEGEEGDAEARNQGKKQKDELEAKFKAEPLKPGKFFFGVMVNSLVQFLFGFALWGTVSQFFGLAFAQYKVINEQTDLWKPFTGLGVGSLAASIIWKRVTPFVGWKYPETRWSTLGCAALFLGILFLNPFEGEGEKEPEALMYIGTVFCGFAVTWFFTNQEISYSKQLTHSIDLVGNSVNMFMAWYGIVGALARFLGPFLAGYAFAITDEDGAPPCSTPTCCVTFETFESETCELERANVVLPILVVLAAASFGLNTWYNSELLSYTKEGNASASAGANAATDANTATGANEGQGGTSGEAGGAVAEAEVEKHVGEGNGASGLAQA